MIKRLLSPQTIITLSILVIASFFIPSNSFAMNIGEGDKVQVVNENTTIDSKYSFIARFNKNKTKLSTFGMEATETDAGAPGYTFYSFNPKDDDSLKGKFGVVYTNVGRYQERDIDLKITVLDWDRYTTNLTGKISFQKEDISEITQGYNSVDQKWEFYEHGTNNLVKISGYMTINDIDAEQAVNFNKETVENIDSILIDPTAENWLKYSESNGNLKIYDESGNKGVEVLDKKAMFTILISETNKLHFKWERNFGNTTTRPTKTYTENDANGEYFGYIAKKPARTEMLDPSKTIEMDGKESSDQLDITANKTFTFNLYHQIPDEWAEFYYSSYEWVDTIDSRLTIESFKATNEEGLDVTPYYDNKSSGNTIKLVAKSSTMQNSLLYGHTYKVQVKVKVKDAAELKGSVQNSKVEFKNKYSVKVNNQSKTSNEVIGVLNERKIDVWHLDKINQTTLEHTTDKKFDGESYSYTTKDTFKKGDYTYLPNPKETKTGTVNGKDIDLKFYYHLPLVDVNMKHIQIYTANATKGLPVKLNITRVYPYGTSISEVATKKVKVELFEKDSTTALISKEYALKDIPTTIEDWKIPKNALTKDTHKNYVVKISGIDDKDVISNNPSIDTDGYTASEKVIKVKGEDNTTLAYQGIVMTEREIKQEMEKHNETLTIPLTTLPKQKTGYGFDLKTEITYKNDLATNQDLKLKSLVDKQLIDSYLNFSSEGNNAIVSLENTKKTTSSDKKKIDFIFELPHINVEEKTGYLFSDSQVTSKDPRIQYAMRDGKRKLYIPIWGDLGTYPISVESAEPVGINEITFQINLNVATYAYMYGTIGSKTLKDDEILIEPVDPNNPFPDGLPDGWDEEDLKWFKNE